MIGLLHDVLVHPDCVSTPAECLQRVQVVVISKAAVDRLSAKLATLKGTGRPVDMAEELRMLTLQVIGEAILSLPPEECDKASVSCFSVPAGQPCVAALALHRYDWQ